MHQSNIAEMQVIRYTGGMSEALGMYLKTLREGRRLRVNEVLQQLGERLRLGKPVDQTRLWRAENGKGWPDGDFLIALLAILQGSLQDVDWLQTHPDATKENAELLAKQRLSVQAQEDALIEAADTDEKRAELLRRIAEMTTDPILRARIEGYLDGLSAS